MSHATDVLNRILAIKKLEPRQLSDELNCSRQLITKMFETGDIDYNVVCHWAFNNRVSMDSLLSGEDSELEYLRRLSELVGVLYPTLIFIKKRESLPVNSLIEQIDCALNKLGYSRVHPVLGHRVRPEVLEQCRYTLLDFKKL